MYVRMYVVCTYVVCMYIHTNVHMYTYVPHTQTHTYTCAHTV